MKMSELLAEIQANTEAVEAAAVECDSLLVAEGRSIRARAGAHWDESLRDAVDRCGIELRQARKSHVSLIQTQRTLGDMREAARAGHQKAITAAGAGKRHGCANP